MFCFDIFSPSPTHLVVVELTHHISSSFVSINNIYNIFCSDINSPSPKVFIDFIVKISCTVRHIDCMASRKLKKSKNFHSFNFFYQVIQLFRERLSEKVHAAIPKGIVGGFEGTVLERNLKEWYGRPRTYVCEY